MIQELNIKIESGGGFTLEDQDGNWLDDSESLEELLNIAKGYGEEHGVDEVSISPIPFSDLT